LAFSSHRQSFNAFYRRENNGIFGFCPIPIMINAITIANLIWGNQLSNLRNRCRLVLIASPAGEVPATKQALTSALEGGDVASVLLTQFNAREDEFRSWCEDVVPVIQAANAAAIVVDDTQAAGRAKADGVHITGGKQALFEAIAKYTPRMIVGTGTPHSRHEALELGEERPDYLFIGKLDGDAQPEANPRALELAEWWASMIEIPCIVMAGYDAQSVIPLAKAGAEFVAVSAAVFGQGRDPKAAVLDINALLEAHAPELTEGTDED
jgi:thiamine-phosphate pyrophosphorylase